MSKKRSYNDNVQKEFEEMIEREGIVFSDENYEDMPPQGTEEWLDWFVDKVKGPSQRVDAFFEFKRKRESR